MKGADYFSAPGRAAQLVAVCESWRGTPFRGRSAVKGERGGVDCASFIGAVFLELGAIAEAVAVPPYEVNHAEHSDHSVFLSWLDQPEARSRVRRVDEDEPSLAGDIVFPRVGRTQHHAGLWAPRCIYHIARQSGWCRMTHAQLVLHPGRYRLVELA